MSDFHDLDCGLSVQAAGNLLHSSQRAKPMQPISYYNVEISQSVQISTTIFSHGLKIYLCPPPPSKKSSNSRRVHIPSFLLPGFNFQPFPNLAGTSPIQETESSSAKEHKCLHERHIRLLRHRRRGGIASLQRQRRLRPSRRQFSMKKGARLSLSRSRLSRGAFRQYA